MKDIKEITSYIDFKLSYLKQNPSSSLKDFFEEMKHNLSNEELANAYNYILLNEKDFKILNQTIREINEKKFSTNFSNLIDFILKPIQDNSFYDLKVLAIKTISNYKDKSALQALLFCLNDKQSNYKIRLAAAEALGKIGDKNAFDSLTKVVTDEKENSAYIKESAVVALGLLGDSRALDVFDTIINTKQMFLDKFSYLKERILEAISKLDISNDKKALDILKKSLMDKSQRVRISAIEALMNSDNKEAFNLIYERLKFDCDLEVKKNALVALYNISDERILNEVLEGNFEEELKNYAKEILEEIGED